MNWYEAEVRELEQDAKAIIVARRPVVFYGSSSIRLWHSLAKDLRSPDAVNCGFGGSTLAACAHFFDRIVTPLQPRALTVYAGDNDLGDGRGPDEVLASFRTLLGKVEQRFGPIFFAFVSIKPSPARFGIIDKIRRVNAGVQQEIALHPWAMYVNVFDAMLTADGQPCREFYVEDGLHLNRAGYELWTKVFEGYRNRLFTEPRPESNANRLLSIDTNATGVRQLVQSPPEP